LAADSLEVAILRTSVTKGLWPFEGVVMNSCFAVLRKSDCLVYVVFNAAAVLTQYFVVAE
jgi:hypothetical protein